MQHNATMSTQMTERFNVAGAMLVKLFGDHEREDDAFERHAAGVRDAGISRGDVRAGVLRRPRSGRAIGAAAIYGVGGHLVVSGDLTPGTLVALAALAPRVYSTLTGLTNARVDLMTSLVSFERVFEVLDAPEPSPSGLAPSTSSSRSAGSRSRTCASATRPRRRPPSARWRCTHRRATPIATCWTG